MQAGFVKSLEISVPEDAFRLCDQTCAGNGPEALLQADVRTDTNGRLVRLSHLTCEKTALLNSVDLLRAPYELFISIGVIA